MDRRRPKQATKKHPRAEELEDEPKINEGDSKYTVKKVINKRVKNGVVEYEIEWANTWEPASQFDSLELVEDYENRIKAAHREGGSGFRRGLTPNKIVAATDTSGKLQFLISWKGIEVADLVTAEEAYQYCPQLVFEFYEKHIHFRSIKDANKIVPMRRS